MRIKIWYDGIELTRYMVVQKVNKSMAPSYVNRFNGLDNVNGNTFLGSKLEGQSISIECGIAYNVQENLDLLNLILFQREPKPLIISDNTDRYLMAILDGESGINHHRRFGHFTLNFVSPDAHWRSTGGHEKVEVPTDGYALLHNRGTAPTPPVFNLTFTSDAGYLALVAPNGFISIGDPKQENEISVPPSEKALDESMTTGRGWVRVGDAENYIPDYIAMSSAGSANFGTEGISLNTSTLGSTDKWHGHAYMKSFDAGQVEVQADNFELLTNVKISDLSGKRTNTMAMLMVVMDANNNPIMTTSIYDVTGDKNELNVTFKIPESSNSKMSKIIHSGKLSNVDGYIKMDKVGNKFSWEVYNNAKTVVTPPRTLKVGDVVRLKPSVKHIYDWDGKRLDLDSWIMGQDLKIFEIRNSPSGKYGVRNVRHGWVEGFFNANDFVETTTTGTSVTTPQSVKYTIRDNGLAQLRPSKVFIWQAKWGASQPYTNFTVKNLRVMRKYSSETMDIDNTFIEGDNLIIDNQMGQIILNGKPYEGYVDYASRFFTVDGGTSEVAIIPSSWATVPDGTITFESRWL